MKNEVENDIIIIRICTNHITLRPTPTVKNSKYACDYKKATKSSNKIRL